MTGLSIVAGNAGLEGLLANATVPTTASPITATPATPLPNAFADLLALLGVAPLVPPADPTESLAPKQESSTPETPTPLPATNPAPPEQIASAIIRAMLTSNPSPTVAPISKESTTAAPATATAAKSPDQSPEPSEDDPSPERRPEVQLVVPALPVLPAPPIHESPVTLPTPAPPTVPLDPRPTPLDAPKPAPSSEVAPTRSQPVLPTPAVPIAPEQPASAAPVAFALQLTPKEVVQPKPAEPRPTTKQALAPAPPAAKQPEREPEHLPVTPVRAAEPSEKPEQQAPHREHTEPIAPKPTHVEHPMPELVSHTAPIAPADPSSPPFLIHTAPAVQAAPDSAPAQEVAPTAPLATPPEPTKPAPAATELSVRVSAPEAAPVDLHVAQRGTEVHVTVRTPDQPLQAALRQDLHQLVERLDNAGFHSEPISRSDFTASDTGYRTPEASSTANDSMSQGQDPGSETNWSGARQQQQQQQRRQSQRQPKQNEEDFA